MRNWAWFYALCALSASAPLLLSPKQKGWYLVPAMPFWGMMLAAAWPTAASRVESWVGARPRRGPTLLRLSLVLVLAAGMAAVAFNGRMVTRERELFHDLAPGQVVVAPRVLVSVQPASLTYHWYVSAFMQRYYRVSLSEHPGENLCLVDLTRCTPGPGRRLNARQPMRFWLGGRD